jgi:hypothetical protein
MVRFSSALASLLTAALLLPAIAPAQASPRGGEPLRGGERWRPAPRTAAWQWQLQGRLDLSLPASVYDIDGFAAKRSQVAALHRRGRRAICYLDVGSWESYRPDRAAFPAAVIGARYEGFPDERWLDVSRFRLFRAPLEARIAICAGKGFDAVEPDNLAGFENDTGFAISAADQLRFNRWIAAQVHRRGMAVALKNDPEQVTELLPSFDFAIVEECFQFDECGRFSPFVAAGKAVFEAEYELPTAEFCDRARALGFSAIGKSYDLFARPFEPCEAAAAGAPGRAIEAAGVVSR